MVLVNTSVCIRFLTGREPYATELDSLLERDEVGLAVIRGTSQANPIQELVLTDVSDQLWVQPPPLPVLPAFQFCKSLAVCFYVWP